MLAPSALMIATWVGCASEPRQDPRTTPTGQACARAYDATVGSVAGLLARRGTPEPEVWPDANGFVRRCLELELDEARVACLDPDHARAHPEACAAALEPAKVGVDALSRWFNAELKNGRPGLSSQVAGAQKEESAGGHE